MAPLAQPVACDPHGSRSREPAWPHAEGFGQWLQEQQLVLACRICGTKNSVRTKRSHQSSWNDRVTYHCALCKTPLGTANAFCVETESTTSAIVAMRPQATSQDRRDPPQAKKP
jgi:hypothetical protein